MIEKVYTFCREWFIPLLIFYLKKNNHSKECRPCPEWMRSAVILCAYSVTR